MNPVAGLRGTLAGIVAVMALVMALVVAGQAWWLHRLKAVAAAQPSPSRVELHESRLLPFLQEIRAANPYTHDSVVLNLTRLRDGPSRGQDVTLEESLVAEQLLLRLKGAEGAAAIEGR
jgi:hypothetical protein